MRLAPTLSRRQFVLGSGAAGNLDALGTLGAVAEDDEDGNAIGACSFDVRCDNPEDDYPWVNRLDRVVEVIDYVFVPESASVEWYRTLEDREGAYRPDHLPVVAMFEPE